MEQKLVLKQFMAIASLLFVTIFWGSTFILVKWTVAEIDLYFFLFIRFILAFLIMGAIFYKKIVKIDKKTLKSAIILGILLGLAFITQTEGLQYTTASNAALITGLYLIFIPIFAAIFFRTKSNLLSVIGAIISLIGLYFLTQYSFTGMNIGDVLMLLCAIVAAWQIIYTGRYSVRHNLIPLVAFQFLTVAIICGVVALFKGGFTTAIPRIAIITIIVTSLFATVLAFTVQAAAQRVIDPTRAGIILAMEAVFGVIFAYWWGGERLTTISMMGGGIMILGMVISEIHPIRRYLIEKLFN